MGLYWNLVGVVGLTLAAVAWLMASAVFWTRPDRTQNRRLALLLALEGILGFGGAGLLYVTDDAHTAYAAQSLTYLVFPAAIFVYLRFLATIDSPLAAPLRNRTVDRALALAALVVPAVFVLNSGQVLAGVAPTFYALWEGVGGPWMPPVFLAWIGASLYGLAVAITAWRRAPAGSAERSRGAAYATAFGVRDVALVYSGIVLAGAESESLVYWSQIVAPQVIILYYLLLAYGILRTQLFDMDLRIKWTLSRGTVAAAFVAAFFVVSEAAQQLFSGAVGPVLGMAAAGLLVFAMAPLQRVADRIADAAMPAVRDTQEYRLVRKHAVYRAAVESALQDGRITEKERDVLATLAQELGLGPADARGIERSVTQARA